MPGLLPLVCCQQGVLKSLEGVWGSVLVQVGGSGGGWIAVVNESRCQVFMSMMIMHMGQKEKKGREEEL